MTTKIEYQAFDFQGLAAKTERREAIPALRYSSKALDRSCAKARFTMQPRAQRGEKVATSVSDSGGGRDKPRKSQQ
jgi:hypothetical protein